MTDPSPGRPPRPASRRAPLCRALGLSALLLLAPALARAGPLRVQTTLSQIQLLRRAIATHQQAVGEAPKNATQLGVVAQLYSLPVPVEHGVPVDAWGHGFVYRPADASSGPSYQLYSIGKNGIDDAGQGDDIVTRAALDPKLYPELFEPALQLLPMLLLIVLGPVLWSVIRASKRAAES
jgi:hypothetical protein